MRTRSARIRPYLQLLFLSVAFLSGGILLGSPPPDKPGPGANGPGNGPDRRFLHLKAGRFDPLTGVPDFAGLRREDRHPAGRRGGYLVQFDHPIRFSDRLALESAGASIKGYVPMMTLEVFMNEATRSRVEGLPGVRWVGVHQPGFKVEKDLLDRYDPPFDPERTIRLQVDLFPGEGVDGRAELLGLGARILRTDSGRSYELAEIEIPAGRLRALTRIRQVRFIDEVYERIEDNDRSRFHTGLADIADDTFSTGIDPALDGFDEGSGFQVKFGHFDGGMNFAHPDFQAGIASGWITAEPGSDTSDLDSGHGTHTAGSIVADGTEWSTVPETPPQSGAVAQNRWRGVLPQAALHHISFETNFTDRQIFEREVEEGVHISSNSWSYSSAGTPLTTYNTNAAVWDDGVWDADDDVAGLQPLVVFFSAGNNGGFNSPFNGCLSDGPDTIGVPALAKNVITVGNNETDRGAGGVCGSFSGLGDSVEEMNASSSRGPADPDGTGQGLFKPDVTNIGGYWVMSTEAPGTASQCSGQTVLPDCPTDCSDTGPQYAYNNGTSMSNPLTAGLAGAIYQDLVVNVGVSGPKPSLIKALLINGARDLQPASCNYTFQVDQTVIHEGWGFVQAKNSMYGPGGGPAIRNIDFENEVTANALATGESYQRQIEVGGGRPLKISLVWTDFPAAAGAGSPLVVNDLDLTVDGPDGLFLGNVFAGNWSVLGGVADRYNVVENVYIFNPTGGTYTITVNGFQVSQDQEPDKAGINQDFSLVWSGDLPHAVCGDTVCEPGEDSCNCPQDCGAPPSIETACTDGRDDDCDGFVDCGDQDCVADPACTPFCGDGDCQPGEDCGSCPADCISGGGFSCGNGVCEIADGEDCLSCPADCNGQISGNPNNRFCCGGGAGDNPVDCSDSRCTSGGFSCTDLPNPGFCCGDLACEGGEDPTNCDVDCSFPAGLVPDGNLVPGLPLTITEEPSGDLTLSWDPSCVSSDLDFIVYQGTLGDFTSHVPILCTTGGATTVTITPPAGSHYYFVVPRNVTREGSSGFLSNGSPRPDGASLCLPRDTGICQ